MQPSSQLYQPENGILRSYRETAAPCPRMASVLPTLETEMRAMMAQPQYPCVAALQAYHKDEYQVGLYRGFGQGLNWAELRNDLLFFLSQQQKSASVHLTFWAVFPGSADLTEEEFENKLWKELSFLTSEEDRDKDWAPGWPKDPSDPKFCLNLGGHAFFVVGVHPNSSRKGRRFAYPALIFNVFDQFETLQRTGQYDSMVQLNRKRDQRFHGDANPMALKHGETWESIQFSGRNNDSSWRCPFQFVKNAEKSAL